MPESLINLDADEMLVRVFTRNPERPWFFSKLHASDFARVMTAYSGISLLRLKFLTRLEALNWFESKKLKGLAICEAKSLQSLGLRFIAKSTTDPHVSVRCPPCNMSADYPTLCSTTTGSECHFDLHSPMSLSKILSQSFKIDTPIRSI
jgi:hypothetical protein